MRNDVLSAVKARSGSGNVSEVVVGEGDDAITLRFAEPKGRKAMRAMMKIRDAKEQGEDEQTWSATCAMIKMCWVDDDNQPILGDDAEDVLSDLSSSMFFTLAKGAEGVISDLGEGLAQRTS